MNDNDNAVRLWEVPLAPLASFIGTFLSLFLRISLKIIPFLAPLDPVHPFAKID